MSVTPLVCVCVCVFVSSMQCVCAILLSEACPTLHYFSTLSYKWQVFLKKEILKISISGFLQLLSEIFFNLRRIVRDMVKKMYIGVHVKYRFY